MGFVYAITMLHHKKFYYKYLNKDITTTVSIVTRDETLEALSDAQVVAPMVLTADTHSALRRNSYLYVFDYQTKYGDYPQVSTSQE